MANTKILIVEDEEFFARNIQDALMHLGYGVSGVASTGEDAVRMAEETRPDLVLMDIVLIGEMDGVEAAEQIHERFDIPVIYLTGLTGDEITERAKITEPFGYILKPFQERELHTIIEIAIYMHDMEKRLRESEGKLNAMLESISDHMVMVDRYMNIVWANKTARQVFGEDMVGKKCCEIYHGRKEPCQPDPCLSIVALENGKVHEFETEVMTREGKKYGSVAAPMLH